MSAAIGNGWIQAVFDEVTGLWESLSYAGGASSIIGEAVLPFDLIIDGQGLYYGYPSFDWCRRATSLALYADGTGVVFTFEEQGLRIIHTIEVAADQPVLRQKVAVECVDARDPRLLGEIVYYMPHLALGKPDDCVVHLPGQRVPVGTPYATLARNGQLELQAAPCHTSGLVVVENPGQSRLVSAWLYSDQMVTFPFVRGDCDFIGLEYRHQTATWLTPGVSVISDGFSILMTEGSLGEHMRAFRELAYVNCLVSPTDTPTWFEDARLFQITPYPIASWTPRLPEIREMGFNLVYLCPVQSGDWYDIYDHYRIAEQVGTRQELKDFVKQAHELGMRVLFDYLPQGVGVNSPFTEQHPDWLVRDVLGRTHASHEWGPAAGVPFSESGGGTLSLDWGNPEYQKFAVDWAMWYVKTFDIDGFRCDALHWKEPNLALANPRPAWETIYGGIRILENLREELKRFKPEAVLLSEVWGPIFQGCTDGSYENGWILHELNESWLDIQKTPLFTATEYMQYLIYTEAARPEGYLRANFTSNHDMQPLARMAHSSPLGNAVSFLHAFAKGIPFVMWLETEGREAFFSTLMRHRSALEGYTCSYTETRADSEDLFLALWQKTGSPAILALSSLSLDPVAARISLGQGTMTPSIVFGSEGVSVAPADDGVAVHLPGGGYALIRFD